MLSVELTEFVLLQNSKLVVVVLRNSEMIYFWNFIPKFSKNERYFWKSFAVTEILLSSEEALLAKQFQIVRGVNVIFRV